MDEVTAVFPACTNIHSLSVESKYNEPLLPDAEPLSIAEIPANLIDGFAVFNNIVFVPILTADAVIF